MKKITLLLAAMAMAFGVQAQVKFGPVAGLNITTMSGDNTDGVSSRVGFHLGGVLDMNFGGFMLQPGVLFSTKGYAFEMRTVNQNFNVVSTDATFNINFIEIPVNLGYNIEVTDGFTIQPYTGPYVGIPLGGTMKVGDTEVDLEDIDTDFGVNLGANIIVSQKILAGLGYGIGFGYEDANFRNFYFRVGYLIGGE